MLAMGEALTSRSDREGATRSAEVDSRPATAGLEVSGEDLRNLLEQNLGLIEQITGIVARRHALSVDDADEFDARVKLRLLEKDCAVLRKWRRDAQLATFLSVVINNFLLDFRVEKWGRWRVSRKARRLGREAMVLETLLERDGYSLDEAIEIIRTRRLAAAGRDELIALAARLPARCRRSFTGEASLERVAAPDRVEDRVEEEEKRAVIERVHSVFAQALAGLEDEDKTLLRLFYQEGITLKDIAVLQKISQRSIYTRHQRCLDRLRRSFRNAGLRWSAVESIIGWDGAEFELSFEALTANRCS